MAKKIKNSVKTEMKNMVQKELARIMAKQISNEDFFKEMIQDVISDFYEEFDEEPINQQSSPQRPWENVQKNRLGHISDIVSGKYKDKFSELINKERSSKSDLMDFFVSPSRFKSKVNLPGSRVELTQEQMDTLFRPREIKPETEINSNLLFGQPNSNNLSILKGINAEQAINDYRHIQYTEEILNQIFDYIEKNKSNLEATHEQTHPRENFSIEIYKVKNKEEENIVEDFRTSKSFALKLNPNYFAFNLEVKTNEITKNKETFLKNVFINGNQIGEGAVSSDNVKKIMNLVEEIYSETKINPISQTELAPQIVEPKSSKNKKNKLKEKVVVRKTKK
jgi:hypothetical protein